MIEKSMLENLTEAKGERNQTEILPLLLLTCAAEKNKAKQFSDSKLKKSPNRFSCVDNWLTG